MTDQKDHWVFDKKIPVALIIVFIVQAITVGIWVGGLDSTVSDHDRRIATLEEHEGDINRTMVTIESRLTRLEVVSEQQLRVLEQIAGYLRVEVD